MKMSGPTGFEPSLLLVVDDLGGLRRLGIALKDWVGDIWRESEIHGEELRLLRA
jgi:hypothetical protein